MEKHTPQRSDQPDMFLHQNIRLLRKRLKLSQEELARRIGLNRGNIASYENGTAEPRICNLLKFARLFGISVYKLTYSDLSREQNLDESSHSFDENGRIPDPYFREMLKQLEQTEELMRSIRTCCHYRQKARKDLSPDLQAFMVHFEDLYQVAEQLLCNQKTLLDQKVNPPGRA
jgi:transcriptional regulator with XRE-family HTH domain